jgi:single-stranded DNA-binding protein
MTEFTQAVVIGTVSDVPNLAYTSSAQPVLNINVRVSSVYHRCVVWGERAEAAAKDLEVGDCVCVVGEFKKRSYDKDGGKQWVTEVHGRVFKGYRKAPPAERDQSDVPF